jgi:hypothetical protein
MKTRLSVVRRAGPVEIQLIPGMMAEELQRTYVKLFGSNVPAGTMELARRRIAWQIQAEREGGLPESAREHAIAIGRNVGSRARVTENVERRRQDLPLQHTVTAELGGNHDSRIPMAGSVIVKEYRGRTLVVHVLDAGFECDGKRYTSLTALAREITGSKWNGLLFFGLTKGKGSACR